MRIIVCGMGVVGQSFLRLLISSSNLLYKNYGIKPRVVACIDSRGIAYSQTGLDLERVLRLRKNMGNLANILNLYLMLIIILKILTLKSC